MSLIASGPQDCRKNDFEWVIQDNNGLKSWQCAVFSEDPQNTDHILMAPATNKMSFAKNYGQLTAGIATLFAHRHMLELTAP